jgi:capsular polysaccharide export protein
VTEFVPVGDMHPAQNRDRHILFLQGLPGPFFRLLSRRLNSDGVQTSRINFNGGDVFDWRRSGATNFRHELSDWPRWLGDYLQSNKVTEIILFGDCRAPHQEARRVAAALGITVHVFEEGYLRPDYVTLERGGVNSNSTLPLQLDQYRQLDAFIDPVSQAILVKSSFGRRAREAIRYNIASIALKILFPHFRSHRPLSLTREVSAWVARWLMRRNETAASGRALARLGAKRFFLFPLQLDGDAQISHHSPFGSMEDAVDYVLQSFAAFASSDIDLLIKRHPFDPDVDHWRRRIEALASSLGILDRIHYIERGELDPLLDRAEGVVTVNSTVGPLALERGVPVIALGDAIYAMRGLTSEHCLDEFWTSPGSIDKSNYDLFRRVVISTSLVNGGFHSVRALDLLVKNAADRLLDTPVAASAPR